MFEEDDYLMLSGIQHFEFCKRQWALIHIENQWYDNEKTILGDILHEKVHESEDFEKRGDVIITRGLRVKSDSLRITGVCDVVEFHKDDQGIPLFSHSGLWKPYPVEYKKGNPKDSLVDKLQLCAQAICLEEMLLCVIKKGAIFYGEKRRREEVEFTEELRKIVKDRILEMHDLWSKGYTPKLKRKDCSACSLCNLCVPKLFNQKSVIEYIDSKISQVD